MYQYELAVVDKKEEKKQLNKLLKSKRAKNRISSRATYNKYKEKYKKKQIDQRSNINTYSDISIHFLRYKITQLKSSSKKKSLKGFSLTHEELLDLIPRDLKCPIFKTKFIFLPNRGMSPDTLSVDRINNYGGYNKDNVIVVSSRANAIKHTATVKELYEVADFYYELEKKMLDK